MDAYRLVFEIAVRHGYYAPAPCDGLRWSCTPDSAQRLQRAGCVLRPTEQGVAAYAEAGRLAALHALAHDAAAPLELTLLARSADPDFAAATDGLGPGDSLLLLDTGAADAPDAQGWQLLRGAPPPGAARLDARALLRALAPAERRMPSFALRLRLDGGDALDCAAWAARALGRRWRVALEARAAHWKYLLPAEWAAQQPRVVDLAGEVQFDPPALEALPDGRTALASCSRSAIALHRRPAQRFQLQALEPHADRVLVRRLPAAAPGALRRDAVAARLVSEIHVNR